MHKTNTLHTINFDINEICYILIMKMVQLNLSVNNVGDANDSASTYDAQDIFKGTAKSLPQHIDSDKRDDALNRC